MDERTYCVYCHKNKINGKRYIGQTCHQNDLIHRWGKNGEGYAGNRHFWSAIQKYGWENFEHTILEDDLTKDEADILEEEKIILFDTLNPEFGYNLRHGGSHGKHGEATKQKCHEINIGRMYITNGKDNKMIFENEFPEYINDGWYKGRTFNSPFKNREPWNKGQKGIFHHSEEAKKKISERSKKQIPWNKGKKMSDEFKEKISIASKNKTTSEETKQKLHDANKGKEPWNKGKHLSEETKEKIRKSNLGKKRSEETCKRVGLAKLGHIPWNKGKVYTDDEKQKYFSDRIGKPLSDETKKKISETLKNRNKEKQQ